MIVVYSNQKKEITKVKTQPSLSLFFPTCNMQITWMSLKEDLVEMGNHTEGKDGTQKKVVQNN